MIITGSHLYAIGGRQFDSHLHAAFGLRAKTLNSVEWYDCASDSWTKVANLPVGLFAHAGSLFLLVGNQDRRINN